MAHRVLYISPCAERAGAEQLTKLFLLKHNPEKWVGEIVFFKDGPFRFELEKLGVVCHVIEPEYHMRLRNPFSVFRLARRISRLIREREINLVHSVMGYGHMIGGIAAWLSKVPEVWYQHGPTGSMDYLTGRVPTCAILTNSEHTKKSQERYHAWTRSIHLIYPALDPKSEALIRVAQVEGRSLREKWGVGDGEFIFGIVGRFALMKGQFLFLKAAEILEKTTELPFKLVFIGSSFEGNEDQYSENLKNTIRQSPLVNRVILTGYLPDPSSAVSACDCIVNATLSAEPFGLTLIEAMELGRAVIAPRAGGPLEIVQEGVDGFFFEPRSPESLAQVMFHVLKIGQEKAEFERMGQAGIRKIRERFQSPRMIRELEAVYESVLERR